MLKLDFSKAYHTVSWSFLFHAMSRMELQHAFVWMVEMLLTNVATTVSINGLGTDEFHIHRGLRQSCPLAFSRIIMTTMHFWGRYSSTLAGEYIGLVVDPRWCSKDYLVATESSLVPWSHMALDTAWTNHVECIVGFGSHDMGQSALDLAAPTHGHWQCAAPGIRDHKVLLFSWWAKKPWWNFRRQVIPGPAPTSIDSHDNA